MLFSLTLCPAATSLSMFHPKEDSERCLPSFIRGVRSGNRLGKVIFNLLGESSRSLKRSGGLYRSSSLAGLSKLNPSHIRHVLFNRKPRRGSSSAPPPTGACDRLIVTIMRSQNDGSSIPRRFRVAASTVAVRDATAGTRGLVNSFELRRTRADLVFLFFRSE